MLDLPVSSCLRVTPELSFASFRPYTKLMRIDVDPDKSARDELERNLPFGAVEHFDWEGALYDEDIGHDYPERRFIALGRIGQRLHVVCFTPIDEGVRITSLRKAYVREVRHYEYTTHE